MKILYVATVVKTHIREFHIPYLKMCKEMGWETAVAAKNDYENPADCLIPYCDAYYDIPFERNPLHPGNISALKKLKRIFDSGRFDIIHCHTPVGAMLTRMAAGKARRNGCKVFYTAHGFHFYRGAPLINWLLYYPAERLLARKTDVLITITKEDYERARHFRAGQVKYVPGVGIDRGHFKHGSPQKAAALRDELGIPSEAKVLLAVGEANANKNHKTVIQALPDFPGLWFVLCGSGPLLSEYRELALQIGVSDRVVLAGYRTDTSVFYSMANLFILPSIREGLPLSLMEAMAAELPCVASRNRGTAELLEGSKLLFRVSDAEDMKEKLRIAINTDCSEEVKRNSERLENYDLAHSLGLIKRFYVESIQRIGDIKL
ncbi:MAG: glycosyltransferase [Clostridia bacterium]|nr:glycosyltransferase [Clostridia bacterium]